MIAGRLETDDVADAWNERFTSDFGITPATHTDGCLQDIHWSAGLLGYFPTYALGNMYAAQFFESARSELGSFEDMFAAGDFKPLLDWLRKHIHQQGQRFPASRLVEVVTGKPLSNKPLMDQMNGRFRPLYGV